MTDHVYLNADKTALVPQYAAGKKYQISRAQAVELGLLDSDEKPVQERRFDATKAHTPPPQRRRKRS